MTSRRQTSYLAYSLARPNIEAMIHAPVARIIFDGLTAAGVEAADGRKFTAMKEVIVTVGAARAPQILLFSGISASAILKEHGIPVVHDLLQVSHNLHDHLHYSWRSSRRTLSAGLPLDWLVNELEKPADLQDAIEKEAKTAAFVETLRDLRRALAESFTMYSLARLPGIPLDGFHIATSTMLLNPTSRGSVSISSALLEDPSLLDFNYFSTEVDRLEWVHATAQALSNLVGSETPPSGASTLEAVSALTAISTDDAIMHSIRLAGADIIIWAVRRQGGKLPMLRAE